MVGFSHGLMNSIEVCLLSVQLAVAEDIVKLLVALIEDPAIRGEKVD